MKELSDEYYALSLELMSKYESNKTSIRECSWKRDWNFSKKSGKQTEKTSLCMQPSHVLHNKLDLKKGNKTTLQLALHGGNVEEWCCF